MAKVVEHLYFFDEVFQGFSRHVAFAKLLYSHLGAQPASLKDISVAATTDKVSLCVDFELFEVDEEVKSVFLQGSN